MTWDRQCQIMLGSVVLDNCCSTGRQSVPLLWCTGTLLLYRPCPPWLNINNSHQASNGCLKVDELIGTHFRKNDQGGANPALIFLEWPPDELTQTVLSPLKWAFPFSPITIVYGSRIISKHKEAVQVRKVRSTSNQDIHKHFHLFISIFCKSGASSI